MLLPHERWADQWSRRRNDGSRPINETNLRLRDEYGPIGFRLFAIGAVTGSVSAIVGLGGLVTLFLSSLLGGFTANLGYGLMAAGVVGEVLPIVRGYQAWVAARQYRRE